MKFIFAFPLVLLSFSSNALVILQYHHISTETPAITSTPPKLFKRHLELIEESGFDVVSIEYMADLLRKRKSLPDKAVVITFDDGFDSIYENAFPLLKKRMWPFAVFVNTQPHNEKQSTHMSWEQLRELQDYGATIANHSVSHAHLLRRVDDESGVKIFKSEILAAERELKAKLGTSVKLFAYPYGEYDPQLVKLMREHGFLGFGQHSGAVADDVDQQQIPRFPFGGQYGSEQDFLTKLKTLPVTGAEMEVFDGKTPLPDAPKISEHVDKPILKIKSPESLKNIRFSCFASGQGAIDVELVDGTHIVQAKKPLRPGRSKYNCTAPAGGGRFYWLSQLWIKPDKNGNWVHQ